MDKKFFSILAAIMVYFLASGSILAQEKYPERPVQAIVAYPPGSATEGACRLMAEFLKKYLGEPVIVLNKPGGAGAIAGNELFKSKPDGYTIAMFNESQPFPELHMNPKRFIYKSEDIITIAQWAMVVPSIFTRYDAPWKSLGEFIDYAKNNPNKLRWGHPGRGNMMWVIGNLLMQQSGIKLLEVPFESDAQMLAALLGNNVDMYISILGPVNMAQMEAKKIKSLALGLQRRVDVLPDVPTTKELGYPLGFPDMYLGSFAPKGTPKEIIAKLSNATMKVTEDAEFKEKLKKIGFSVWYSNTKDFEATIEEFARIKWNLLKKLGVL